MKTYAIISDVHGNLLALNAVLADIRSRGIETIINLGDHFFGALDPEGVFQVLKQNPMTCITGNTDREILQSVDNGFEKKGMDFVRKNLSDEAIAWLRTLPNITYVDDIFLVCHGTPWSDDEYLLEKVTQHGVFVYNDEELLDKIIAVKERIVLCGHSHVNRVIYLSNNQVVLNPGSVGLPAYLGNGEHRFSMESNSPHAKYAIVHTDGFTVNIEQVLVGYDWNQASEMAKANGNPDAARFLLYGRMPKDLRVN